MEALGFMVAMVILATSSVNVKSASIGRGRVQEGGSDTCATIPPYMFSCNYGLSCSSDEECPNIHGTSMRCCLNPCGFKSCVVDNVHVQPSVYSQELSLLDRPVCPIPTSLFCSDTPPCYNDYHCAVSQFPPSSSDVPGLPPNVPVPDVPPNGINRQWQAIAKCCPSLCGFNICTRINNVPLYFMPKDVPCPLISSVRCFPWFCSKDEHCIEGEICCRSECGKGVCTPATSPLEIPPPVPVPVAKVMSNKTALIAKFRQMKAAKQGLYQCPLVCEPTSTELRCTSNRDCSPRGLKCCPNACGRGGICTRPVARARVTADKKITDSSKTPTNGGTTVEHPTTGGHGGASDNPNGLEETLIQLLA